MNGNSQQLTWTERLRAQEAWWKRIVILVGVAVIAIQGARIAIEPGGDFRNHWRLGRRLAQGQFIYYADGKLEQSPEAATPRRAKDYPYPPFWALAHAPLTLLSETRAQLAIYPLFAISFVALLWILGRLTEPTLPVNRQAAFWISVAAVLLASRFLIRDMPECGVNLALVTLSWGAVYLWSRRRELLAGTSLGLAIALKCTPALFLAYFVWKRQWKMVAATTCAVALFTLSPVLMVGPSQYGQAMRFWFVHAWEGFGSPDPSMGVLGPEQIQNVSLRPALARFLMHLPPGHASRLDHSLYFDVFDLSPATAGMVIKLILLALVGGIAWRFRAPVDQRNDLRLCWECAAVSILILMLSPITWGQHCVGTLPVLYLVVRSHYSAGPHPQWIYALVGLFVAFTLILNRTLLGKDLTWLLDSYRVPTWCLLALAVIAVACHRGVCNSALAWRGIAIRHRAGDFSLPVQLPTLIEQKKAAEPGSAACWEGSANLHDH